MIISKNRYGLANQVLGCAFYGATGLWKDLPPGKDIPDQSIYFDQSKNNDDKKLLIGTGYDTWGMTNGSLAGKILSDIILRKRNKYINLFNRIS